MNNAQQNPADYLPHPGIATTPADSFPVMLDLVSKGIDLNPDQATTIMNQMMTGNLTDIEIAGFLMAMQTKGPSAQEISAFVSTMRSHMKPVSTDHAVVDPVGTGGDMVGTINISTISSVVAAGAGVKIGKHGNKSVSSKCGSADLVDGWEIPLNFTPQQISECIDKAGIALMFAPIFHPAVRHVMPARKALKVPTIFNILGPLCNPIGAVHQTVGVAFPTLAPLMAQTLLDLNAPHSLVFLGHDGLDEITISGLTRIWEIKDGDIKEYDFDPRDYGIPFSPVETLKGGDKSVNVALSEKILHGEKGPMRDAIILAAAASIIVGQKASNWEVAIGLAEDSLDSGKALETRDNWRRIANDLYQHS